MEKKEPMDSMEERSTDSGLSLGWLREQLHRRARETDFLHQSVFPRPARRRRSARMASGGSTLPNKVIMAAVLGVEHTTCAFYVTQPLRLIGRKLFVGLQPEPASFPRTWPPMKLSICLTPDVEVDSNYTVAGRGEFQLIVELDQQRADQLAAGSENWNDDPSSIPFGLVLRPIE